MINMRDRTIKDVVHLDGKKKSREKKEEREGERILRS